MDELTENEKSFVRLMTKSDEHARRGFALLGERADGARFFDELRDARLFDPSQGPGPEPTERPGSFRIPYWPALSYLLACAKVAAQQRDPELARKIMGLVREAGRFREANGDPRDNPTTFAALAEIIGTLPPAVVALEDIDMMPSWLGSRFGDCGMAAALDRAIQNFLSSEQRANWQKALRILQHCLAVRWARGGTNGEDEPVATVDAFWLGQIVGHNATGIGRKTTKEAAEVFRDTVQEVFAGGSRAKWSWLFRPAVESHQQNHSWRQLENAAVDGLRDATLAWFDSVADSEKQRGFVTEMLRSKVEMIRRVGIYLLDCRWDLLGILYGENCTPELFAHGHRHELFGLLRNHFDDMGEREKEATVAAIGRIAQPDAPNGAEILKNEQRRWLEALPAAYPPVAEWLKKLDTETTPPGQHADFNSYMESAWGPGPSPYPADDLVAFAMDGTLVERLNTFVPPGTWRGPTVAGLESALGRAVASAPQAFLDQLGPLSKTKPEYQHTVVSAFSGLWKKEQPAPPDWPNAWRALMDYFEKAVQTQEEQGPKAAQRETPPEQWLLAAIADLLHDGTREDAQSYPVELLPRGWALLGRMADVAETNQSPAREPDVMIEAINSPKGRVIEAIFSHALRECRVAQAALGSHREAWDRMQPLFERELQKCATGNYEFSTLAGAYLSNLMYLAPAWLRTNIGRVFPAGRPDNLASALLGLRYAQPTREIYALLRESGVIETGLNTRLADPGARKVLVHHLMREYLLGGEELGSPQMALLLDPKRLAEIETAAWFLNTAQHHSPTGEQKTRIVAFWDQCDRVIQVLPEIPGQLLTALGALAWALPNAEGRNRELLLRVTPRIGRDFRAHEFLRELSRLCDVSPAGVADVFLTLLTPYDPVYDYDDLVKSVIRKLASAGQREKALNACEQLRTVSGIPELSADILGRS